jgi:hypothetical protein
MMNIPWDQPATLIDLDGKTPDGRFSDAQCVFWSLLPDSVRKGGLYLSTDPN